MSERKPSGSFTRSHASDDAIDRALDDSLTKKPTIPGEPPLKKLWDDDLERELQEAMAGFDGEVLKSTGPRTRAADRAHVPKEGRGQEDRPGVQKAKVIAIRGDNVFLDMGAKSEGLIPLTQFDDAPPEVGQIIDVIFDRFDRAEGLLLMKLPGTATHATWANLQEGLIVEGKVVKEIKGGLEVEVNGLRGFLPIGQVEIGRVEDLKPYINQRFRMIVSDFNAREKNLVVSRRDLLEQERAEMREKTWADLAEGQVRKGVVRSIKDFGAFVDLGGVDGLVHVSDLAWSRGAKPSDLLRLGDVVEVKVLRIDQETKKVGLGLKQLAPSPWDTIEDRLDIGQTIEGTVTRVADFGAFVEIEPGIEGLVHVSELSAKRVWRVKDHATEGQKVQVRILDIDTEKKRISLSMKPSMLATTPVPSEEGAEGDEGAAGDLNPAASDATFSTAPKRKVPLKGGLGDSDPNPFEPRSK
jgi:small subunit ribosomal protein S1